MACPCKKIVSPAMNHNMYHNPIVQDNIKKLASYGYEIITPDSGMLANGDLGVDQLTPQGLVFGPYGFQLLPQTVYVLKVGEEAGDAVSYLSAYPLEGVQHRRAHVPQEGSPPHHGENPREQGDGQSQPQAGYEKSLFDAAHLRKKSGKKRKNGEFSSREKDFLVFYRKFNMKMSYLCRCGNLLSYQKLLEAQEK